MENSFGKECICKKDMSIKENTRPKAFGLINPAFDNLDITLHFPESHSTPISYYKVDTLSDSDEGQPDLNAQQFRTINSRPNSPNETAIEVESLFCDSMRATPLKRAKKCRNTNCCQYFQWLFIWCVITVSFAGICASIATIIWLETYKEVKSNSTLLMNIDMYEDYDTILSSTETLTQSSLL